MKTKIGIAALLLGTVALLTSCENTRYTTEWFIKNKLEQHSVGETSTIRTYSIYQGFSLGNKTSKSYIEFTGCKYNNTKKLVVGADKYFVLRQHNMPTTTVISEPSYVILDMSQCVGIITYYNQLMENLKAERPIPSEEVYYDYTPSTELFISFRKAIGYSGTNCIDVWVDNEKYTIQTKRFISKMKRFINY